MVLLLCVMAIPIVFFLGLATFGAGWFLYLILTPLVALSYIGWTVGGPNQATIGMRMTDIRLERYDGRQIDFMTAVVHAVLFWASMALATPLLLLPILGAPLFLDHKRTLHDLVMGTVAVRTRR